MNHIKHPVYLLVSLFLLMAEFPASAFTAKDADTMARAFNNAFYSVNGANGFFKDTQTSGSPAYFWGQAEMIECVIDAYEWTTNATYKGMITNLLNGFTQNNGTTWTSWNIYNDDIMWATIAFARGGVDTGNMNYCNLAKANFDACYARAWDSTLGGGFYWSTDNQSKNACANGTAAIAAYLLYQIYGDTNYLNKAKALYNWERSVLYNTNTGAIYDSISTGGSINYWSSTYNQGTFIGAANFLGLTNDATLAANFTMANMTTGGVLPEYGIAGNNSGFNAIFLRWMTRFMRDHHLQSTYEPWLQINAEAAWDQRRADNLSWCQWLHPSPAGTNFYAWDCISSFETMMAAEPTEGASTFLVPTGCNGYWPLDATSGNVAADASGNGNDGAVSGATWNSSGRINGCLMFNGINSSVRVNNPMNADFSIVFWVKTTQTAGTGQWYNGAGLVDGDVPSTKNDFGTALVGSKFAFGIGNPDTTIFSTSSINDGVWHQCVATRQQVNGAIKIYVDGHLQASGTGNQNSLRDTTQLLFGAIASGGGYFNGSLDDVQFYARTLSSDEVLALYNCRTIPPVAAPVNLTATAGNGQVQLNWWSAPNSTSYNVKRSLADGGPYVTITNVSHAAFTDTNVLSNRTYYYVVSAVNDLGESTNSPQVSANISTLSVWLKADALAGLTDGASVSDWPDMSGHGYDAIQTISANQPTYVANAINGQPAVRFNSVNQDYLWFYRPVQDDFTMIFVFKSTQGVNTGLNFWEGAGLVNGEQGGTVNDFGTSLNASGQILAGVGNPDTSIHSGTGLNNGQPHVVTFKRIKSIGAIYLYVDGTPVSAAVGGKQSLTSPNRLILAAQQTLNNYFSGDIAEVQIYNSALADADRTALERALKCKYGIAGGATPLAPAGLSGVAGNRKITLTWTLVPGATDYSLWRSIDDGASYQMIVNGLTTSSYVDTAAANGQLNYYKVAATDSCGDGSLSIAMGVMLPVPQITMTINAGSMALSWPGWATGWQLYSATNLMPPVVWWPVKNAVGSNDGAFSVTLPMGLEHQFFRLASPAN